MITLHQQNLRKMVHQRAEVLPDISGRVEEGQRVPSGYCSSSKGKKKKWEVEEEVEEVVICECSKL